MNSPENQKQYELDGILTPGDIARNAIRKMYAGENLSPEEQAIIDAGGKEIQRLKNKYAKPKKKERSANPKVAERELSKMKEMFEGGEEKKS